MVINVPFFLPTLNNLKSNLCSNLVSVEYISAHDRLTPIQLYGRGGKAQSWTCCACSLDSIQANDGMSWGTKKLRLA